MNVEMINELQQIKSTLARAYKSAERQLRDPFSDPVSISNYLLTRIHVVTQDIDEIIKEEEDALEAYYQEYLAEGVVHASHAREQDAPSSCSLRSPTPSAYGGEGFNPLIHACASDIAKAFGNCWVAVRASRQNEEKPEYIVTIQPDNHNTPMDIQLVLKSLGYAPTFKSIRELESATWADFEVKSNGIAFDLTAKVESLEPPELDRFDEPAMDEELPF